jgi:hypothetical protein
VRGGERRAAEPRHAGMGHPGGAAAQPEAGAVGEGVRRPVPLGAPEIAAAGAARALLRDAERAAARGGAGSAVGRDRSVHVGLVLPRLGG